MAIPGLRPSFEVRAKVRVGEKKEVVKNGKTISFPSSTDYFVCTDPDYVQLFGNKPRELTVMLPFEKPEDNFSTGLEQWAGAMLVCYTKGDERTVEGVHDAVPVAYRKATLKRGNQTVDLLKDFNVLGPAMGNDRRPVFCAARACPMMVKGDCKPMGRLQFFIKGCDHSQGVFQFDTKSWNSIEKIEAFLSVLGDPRGQELTLRVEMWSKGTSKFPVVTLEGGKVEVNTAADVALADQLVQLEKFLGNQGAKPNEFRAAFAAALDLTNPGWREDPAFIARIKEIGTTEAAKGLLKRYEL